MNSDRLLIEEKQFKSISEIFDMCDEFTVIAGPCAIECEQQMEQIAQTLVKNDVKFIRGGAFKPRTSPHSFQGLEIEGLKILQHIGRKYSLYTVSEIVDTRDIELGVEYTDMIQIGSRSMQNFSLLKEVGKTKHPVLLKRGMMSTVEEFILAAEYIVKYGNENIILCERGIRTFENSTRNTLDITSIPIIQKSTSLPVIVDLSHSLGRKDIILPIAKAVMSAGANGLMLETHDNPDFALSDGKQQLDLIEFQKFHDDFKVFEKILRENKSNY